MFTRRTLIYGVAALALFALAVTAGKGGKPKPPPQPPPPADPAILYTVNEGGYDTQIWVMNDDGSNQTRLVSAATHGMVGGGPSWAPDNQRIAFNGWNSGSPPSSPYIWRLYVADLDTTDGISAINVRSIYRNPEVGADAGNPVWSPDGEWLFFYNWVQDGGPSGYGYDLYAIRPDGSDVVRLMSTPGRNESKVSIDPDGTFLVYEAHVTGEYERPLYKGTLGTDGNGRPVITDETCLTDAGPLAGLYCEGTRIDPTGTRVATTAGGDAWIISLETPYAPWTSPVGQGRGSWLDNSTLVYRVYFAKPRQFHIAKGDIHTGAETILDSMKGPRGNLGGPAARWPSGP
jgi:hypothetical protein